MVRLISDCIARETEFFQEFRVGRCALPAFEPAKFAHIATLRAHRLITITNKMIKGMLNAHRLAAKSGGKPNARAIPVDKFSLLAPYIALASTIIIGSIISVAYIKIRKKQ
jgi:hypothetical protein